MHCQNNYYEVELFRNPTFKPIPYSSWIQNNTQQKPFKQKMYKTDLFPIIEKENLTDNINLSGPPDTDSNQEFNLYDPLDNILSQS